MVTTDELPDYRSLILPTLRAVQRLGGSAQAREITAHLIESQSFSDEQLALTYGRENSDKSVLIDRIDWARSYSKLGGALDSPKRGLFLLSSKGKELLALSTEEAEAQIYEMDRQVRAERRAAAAARGADKQGGPDESDPEDGEDGDDGEWRTVLLRRLHRLSPEGFEEFVMYALRTYGLEMARVGGSGDEGIDGIGLAPINDVLSTRVAVQAKKYEPSKAIGREHVALFQRDASAAGAERAIFVTLSRFSEPARRAATFSTPTVDLIDGDKLCDLVLKQAIGVRAAPRVDEDWFNRFD